ncbi:hypothetical protein L2E82_28141 [Cichorium intybus]|uniref:Uncharacterized protein n=1 Tax=Cichorium intybus TaxID=13427 RepID=A0ACB9CV09_CICIN|nr:hypothetical protein L2E82_28141 [Cichorium intybus]
MLLLLGLLINLLIFTDAQSVGVCYGGVVDGSSSQQDVVNLYKNNSITRMRIYQPNQAILQALKGTNIELIIGVPNDALQSLNNQNAANTWVRDNIQNYPDVQFRYVAVGNEVDPNNGNSQHVNFVLPAMQNVQNAINVAGLGNQIKVSTATYSGLLGVSYPPSNGAFRDNVRGFIEPIVKFLSENNSPMLVNIYPYFASIGNPNSNLPYALFTAPGTILRDNGRQYSNLFDTIIDAHYAAQASLGGENVEIVVSESGWPSEGGDAATIENAGTYYKNLIRHVTATTGTPAKPGRSIETYLYSMFDERNKTGAESEKHFGIFSVDERPKYQLSFNVPKSMNVSISERYGILAAFSLM